MKYLPSPIQAAIGGTVGTLAYTGWISSAGEFDFARSAFIGLAFGITAVILPTRKVPVPSVQLSMKDRHVYDKAKYHYEAIEKFGLSEDHASNHIAPMLRWLVENDMMSEFFVTDCADELARFRAGELSIHELYGRWGHCIISDMLSEKGNAFAMHYFDFEQGAYLKDYRATLLGSLPSELHIEYSEENYAKLKPLMDAAFARWSEAKKPWWKIWG
jgi:hypothetical protein